MPHTPQPYFRPDPQPWAITQEKQRQTEAVYRWGEYVVFALMWRVQDFAAGLVDRCPDCYTAYGLVAEVFDQPAKAKCPTCFGTTFDGGYRALLVRPVLWGNASEIDQRRGRRGEDFIATVRVQVPADDFQLRTDDYIFRSDGTRWQIKSFDSTTAHTGFGPKVGRDDNLSFQMPEVAMEDPSTVAYLMPPDAPTLASRLTAPGRFPESFADLENVRGPLT